MQRLKIRLYISAQYMSELNDAAKEIYVESDRGSKYYVEFPADIAENEYLGNHVIASCEAAIIMLNPRYEIDENTQIECELMKLGKEADSFNLLVHIQYPHSEDVYHEILLFKECEIEEYLYSFEFIGDQRMFASEKN